MINHYSKLRDEVEARLSDLDLPQHPSNLYEPIRYMLSLGGKRIRPVLTLMACQLLGKDYKEAMSQALAIEVFHNFTLVHDDIMDSADVRRNLPTVHKKWDHNIALLSGDGMLVAAYRELFNAPSDRLKALGDVFNQTALEVCEGQQLDMDFSKQQMVSVEDYLEMIRLKTAVLLGGAVQLGGIMAGASPDQLRALNAFAVNLGMAFQIRDDYLDAFGDQNQFGKSIGGDIKEGKRTWLTVTSFAIAGKTQREALNRAFNNQNMDERIHEVKAIYQSLSIESKALEEIQIYSEKSIAALHEVEGLKETESMLKELVTDLMGRQH